MTKSYAEDVLKYMLDNGSITSMDAIREFGCTRLSAVIYLLRQEGYTIVSQRASFKNRHGHTGAYAVYILTKGKKYGRKESSKSNKNRSKK